VSDEGGTGDEERSQWRIDPSDPPETTTGWIGCHVTATESKRFDLTCTENGGAYGAHSKLLFCDL